MSGPRDGEVALVVAFREPEFFAERLASMFPKLEITATRDWDAVAAELGQAEILVTHGVGLTGEMVTRMPKLAWIQSLLSGTDQLAPARVARPDLLVTSCRGIHGVQMTEMALLHMLALSRGIVHLERNRATRTWERLVQLSLEQKTAVIVGMGQAGTRVARICKALDMTVYAVTRTNRPLEGVDRVFMREELLVAARDADYLVLTLAHDADTHELFGAEVFAAMKPGAFVINIGRGGLIDEPALIRALQSGQISGAGLDVTAVEPLPDDSPLWEMENVVLTPHLAGRSDYAEERALAIVAANITHYLEGEVERMVNVVPYSAGAVT